MYLIKKFYFLTVFMCIGVLQAKEIENFAYGEDESVIPIVEKEVVDRLVHKYIYVHPEYTQEIISRSYEYFPVIESILEQENLPDELKYITVIESEFVVKAHSYQGAAGLWQLVPRTAKSLGLTINSTVDERMDVYASTYAALKYLKELYEIFDDWGLALAAYNCGPYRLKKTLKESGYQDLGFVSSLPKETQAYYNKFRALKYIFENYQTYDLVTQWEDASGFFRKRIEFPIGQSLKNVAEDLGLNAKELQALNPHILNPRAKLRQKVSLVLPLLIDHRCLVEGGEGIAVDSTFYVPTILEDLEADKEEELFVTLGLLPAYHRLWNRLNKSAHSFMIPNYQYAYINNLVYQPITKELCRPEGLLRTDDNAVTLRSFRQMVNQKSYIEYAWSFEDTLPIVATRFNKTVDEIIAFNDPRAFRTGRVIRIPI